MRSADCDILIVPGHENSGPDHWQSRWQEKLPTARRVEQADWNTVDLDVWSKTLLNAVAAASRPVVIVAHSCGVNVTVHCAAKFKPGSVKGAMLVTPCGSRAALETDAIDTRLAHLPLDPLPFPSLVFASHSDPYCPFLEAEEWAYAWGSSFIDAGESGHLNTASGHGPWPEGLMRFAGFLGKL